MFIFSNILSAKSHGQLEKAGTRESSRQACKWTPRQWTVWLTGSRFQVSVGSPQSLQNTAGCCVSLLHSPGPRPGCCHQGPVLFGAAEAEADLEGVWLPYRMLLPVAQVTGGGEKRVQELHSRRWVCSSLPCRLGSVFLLLCPPLLSQCPWAVKIPVPWEESAERVWLRPQEVAVKTTVGPAAGEVGHPASCMSISTGQGERLHPGPGAPGLWATLRVFTKVCVPSVPVGLVWAGMAMPTSTAHRRKHGAQAEASPESCGAAC